MKKTLSLCCLCLCSAAAMLAQRPSNEAFYLVGTMTDWELPKNEGVAADWQYKLTDPDGDGVYTGSFDFQDSYTSFMVFSEPGTRNDADIYFGCEYESVDVYNTPGSVVLDSAAWGNVNLGNWKGGTLDMSIEWVDEDGVWRPLLKMSGAGQPDAPEPKEFYMVGEFNDWKLPTADSDNGARKLTTTDNNHSKDNIECGPGNIEMALCSYVRSSDRSLVFVPEPYYDCPFTLYAIGNTRSSYRMQGNWRPLAHPRVAAININDWKGGTYQLKLSAGTSLATKWAEFIPIETQPVDIPKPLYLLVKHDGESVLMSFDSNMYIYGRFSGNSSIILTSENSLDPDPANCWGISTSLDAEGINSNNRNRRLPLVKGGNPLEITFPFGGEISVDFAMPSSTVGVDLTYYSNPVAAEKMYVCGNVVSSDGKVNDFLAPSVVNQEVYDQYFRLTKVEPGVFEGTYWVQKDREMTGSVDDLPQFRFFYDLLGWTNTASLGSASEDFYCMPVNLSHGPVELDICDMGLGNWGPCRGEEFFWTPGFVKMTVNVNTMKLRLEAIGEGGVDGIPDDMGAQTEAWYNLQGLKVDKPESGVYIHVIDGKSRLETVK